MNNWHDRFKAMKDALDYTNKDIAKITGNTEDSIKSTTQPNKAVPRWLKLAIVIFEKLTLESQIETAEKWFYKKHFSERESLFIKYRILKACTKKDILKMYLNEKNHNEISH